MGVPPATLSDNLTVVMSSPSSSCSLHALKVMAEKRVTAATAKKLKWLILSFLIVFFMVFYFKICLFLFDVF
jgi:hypothetical protein